MVSYNTLKTLAAGSVLTALIGATIGTNASYGMKSLPDNMNPTEKLERQTEYVRQQIHGGYVTTAGVLLGVSAMAMLMRKSRLEDIAAAKHDDLNNVFE